VVINPVDAAKAGIACGDSVKLTSALGSITLAARVADTTQPGLLFAASHCRETQINLLTAGKGNTVAVSVQKA
jgi:predicted molibdopterin-dependent oxidoreductase YjgC